MAKPPPAWVIRLNVAFLRHGLAVGSQHLLSVRGRNSGVIRTTRVSLVTLDGTRYVVAAFAEADRVKNVRAERAPVQRAFLGQVRGFDSVNPDAVVASVGRYPVIRIDASR